MPCIFVSVPFAFIGGNTQVDKEVFVIILAGVLILSGMAMMMNHNPIKLFSDHIDSKIGKAIIYAISSILGYIAGLVGIGGGIFLSPLLFLMKAGYPKHIATTASLFILINSIFGVAGQLTKDIVFNEFLNFWPLFLAVLVGGQIGNLLNIKLLSNKTLALITSLLVIFVAARMGLRLTS